MSKENCINFDSGSGSEKNFKSDFYSSEETTNPV